MTKTLAKTRNYVVLTVVLIIAIIAVGGISRPVAADPCLAQLSYPVMPTGYSYSSVPIVVPVSATCTTYYGSQLYATGNAYDVTSNAGLGSVSTVLQSVNGGNTFNGQLSFNLPSSTQGDTVQLAVSIYNGQYGNLITATSETIQIGFGNQQIITTTTVTQAYQNLYQNQYLPQNQYPSPNMAPSYQHPSHENRNQSQYQFRNQYSSNLFGFVAIVAILAAVIIATAGLVAYGRRQQPVTWIPPPPPPR